MTIQVTDIQLRASERLTDNNDGGGRMTGQVIESGVLNNLFADISRLDRTYGRLSLRKAYMAVNSADTDTYLGSHVIVTDPPDDERIAVTMFTTGSVTDLRANAQDRIESYVTVGPLAPYYLFGNQPKGARAISLLGRIETPLPEVGDVLVLSVENGATVTAQQYVRVADIASESRTFTDEQGDFQRKVVTVTLTGALRQTYLGAEANRLTNVIPPTRIRQTTVADASTYYGVSKLAEGVSQNALELTVSSITAQLVPATTRETAIAGATPGLALSYIAAGIAQALEAGTAPRYQFRGVLPGSVAASVPGGSAIDLGGNLVVNGSPVGTVDYESGKIDGTTLFGGTYIPAAAVSGSTYTFATDVTLANQGTVYVLTLPTIPAPGTLSVSFRYLGKWYTLRDTDGAGSMEGSSAAEGGGTIDYQSGNVTLTLGAVPDAGSKIVYAWGDPTSYQQHVGDLTVDTPTVTFQLTGFPVKAGSLTVSWISNGVSKSVVANEQGTLSGDGTGRVIYLNGLVILRPNGNAYPDSNSKIDAEYLLAEGQQGNIAGTYQNGQITLAMPANALPLKPGMFSGTVSGFSGQKASVMYFKDDGAGGIVTAFELAPKTEGQSLEEAGAAAFQPIIEVNGGSIDYLTGQVIIQPGSLAIRELQIKNPYDEDKTLVLGDWNVIAQVATFVPSPILQVRSQRDSAAEADHEESTTFPGLKLILTRTVIDPILPGSVWFTWGGKTYVDRQGKVFRDMDSHTGAAVEAGTIDYQTGAVLLTNYGTSTGGPVTIKSLVTRYGNMPVSYSAFRTPGSPLRPSTFSLQAVRVDTGEAITATSDANGTITGSFIGGRVDNDMGFAKVKFGSYVPAAGNENEPWYDPANVVGANVWKPILIDPTTLRFNCVVQTTLPLSADVLGIDPVRLPLTGRVPIFRDGDVVVVHERTPASFPAQVSPGQAITVAGAPFGQFDLRDANGDDVAAKFWTVDMDSGVVTMAADLDGLAQPLSASVVLEDMVLVSSVDLSGRLTLAAPLSRNYSTSALVSSALLFGDLQAQNPIFFSQQTWQGTWSDTLSGSGTTAQYNRTLYPLEVINADATTERWAFIFTSPSVGNIVGETLGQIGQFSTGVDAAPINPLTGKPYFILRHDGWGGGWGVNNVLRFNTIGPTAPIWIARTVLPGAAASGDEFRLQMRGDTQ